MYYNHWDYISYSADDIIGPTNIIIIYKNFIITYNIVDHI